MRESQNLYFNNITSETEADIVTKIINPDNYANRATAGFIRSTNATKALTSGKITDQELQAQLAYVIDASDAYKLLSNTDVNLAENTRAILAEKIKDIDFQSKIIEEPKAITLPYQEFAFRR